MMGSERFYCVSCHALKPMEGGQILFKTGYFRVVYPLGCCEACRSEATVKQYAFAAETAIVRRPAGAFQTNPASVAYPQLEWAVG